MPITYDEQHRIFTLNTRNSTYQFMIDSDGNLLHLYYGRKSDGFMKNFLHEQPRAFSGVFGYSQDSQASQDESHSLDYLPQEFPVQGTGDFRSPLLIVRDEFGTFGCKLRYDSHEIRSGKYALNGLPAVYENSGDNASTLEIILRNDRLNLSVKILYGVLPELDIITRSAIVKNSGHGKFTLEKLQSACLDFTHGNFDVINFQGRHAMERQFERRELLHGSLVIDSRRGMSSHQSNPFVILADHNATENFGRCWSMMFVYSGEFKAEISRDQYDQTRFQMGLEDEKFSYTLEPNEEITAPEVIMTFSSSGFEKISHNMHDCIRKNICRGFWRDKARPVILNSWEAFYFDISGEKLLEMARYAKKLGVDMLVIDDGWFINRNDELHALGDWTPDEKKLGMNLESLVKKINAIGLDVGLWLEPEMVSENSNLYREHPDWAFVIPNENPTKSRHQLVLDLSNRDVRKYILDSIFAILASTNVKYIKWDYNRSISEVYSHAAKNQGKVLYEYILGLYEILGKINAKYPEILIEGCSGGGGRFDAGMLQYTPQIWCSDNTDAIDRLYIQYGTSFAYPASVTAAHVSTCPNHQNGRITPLSTRGIVAMTGAFGYELDPAKLSEHEQLEIGAQISRYKSLREIITDGLYYRLSNPSENFCAWEYVSRDKREFLLNVVIPQNHGNMPRIYVTPRGLEPGKFYRNTSTGEIYASDALMDSGFALPVLRHDFESCAYLFEIV